MKKFLFIFALLFFLVGTAQAQQINVWYAVEKGNWKTVQWDAVTQLSDGDPLPAPSVATLGYNIYAKNVVTGTIVPIATNIQGTSQEVALPSRGSYIAGVEPQLLYVGTSEPSKGTVSWSEAPEVCQNAQTFGYRFQTAPKSVGGLR
jgi:hypothetical protein